MDWSRWLRHAFATNRSTRRAFPPEALGRIEAAVTASERLHAGEIRVAVEGSLEPGEVARGKTPRERALEVFAALGVWDTDANNGVLIYVLLADQRVEIVADQGIAARVAQAEWQAACALMQESFRAGRFEAGAVAGIEAVSALLARHFPAGEGNANELPDQPLML